MKIRDKRQKEWFIVDNIYLNGYAKIFGPIGTSVYISLCRHVDNETQKCFPSMATIAEEIGSSRNTISKYIKMLSDYNLISVVETYDTKNKKRKNNVYTLLDKSVWKAKPCTTVGHGNEKPCTNESKSHAQPLGSNNTHINNTHISETSSQNKNTIKIIDEFKVWNKSASRWYANTTQRKACEELLTHYQLERILMIINKTLPTTNTMEYFPTITTPLQLLEKWSALESAVKKKQEATRKLSDNIAFT